MFKHKLVIYKGFTAPDFIRKIILSWLIAVMVEFFILPFELRNLDTLDGLAQMSFTRILVLTVIFSFFWGVLSFFVNTQVAERWSIVATFGVLSFLALRSSATLEFYSICGIVLISLIIYGIYGWDNSTEPIRYHQEGLSIYPWITAVLSVLFFLFVSIWAVGRVYSFTSPTFDLGIFSQMFYYMKEIGIPMTTVERDGLLSHFAIHVSPIYYLLLPFYCLCPIPATLQVLQAAIITSAVIPLWNIGKHYGLTGMQRMLICVILMIFPAYSGGTGYDIHENCFLTPLILWLFYGIDKKNKTVTFLAAILTLMVKEDAAIYVAVISVWLIVKTLLKFKQFDKQNLITGTALLIISLIWFFLVTTYLAKLGDGVMTSRYENFMYDGSSSLITVIKSVILNPMKLLYECADSEKTLFITLTMLPLLGLPLLTRRYERYILLIPYVLVNLMSDWEYQHNIMFQYTFGSNAFLIYLSIINLADLKIDRQRLLALTLITIITCSYFSQIIIPIGKQYPIQAIQDFDDYQNIRNMLDTIPHDASVTASTKYTTYLSQREVLYDVLHSSQEHLLGTDYVVLNPSEIEDFVEYVTDDNDNGYENLIRLLEENGYTLHLSLENVLIIYRK